MTISFLYLCSTNSLFETPLLSASFCMFVVAILMGWGSFNYISNKSIDSVELFWILLKTAANCVAVCAIAYHTCDSEQIAGHTNTLYFIHGCNHDGDKILSDTLLIFSMFHPILLLVMTKSIPFILVAGSWVAIGVTLLAVVIENSAYLTFAVFVFVLLITAIFMYEYQRQNTELYQALLRVDMLRAENAKMVEEVQANELRHMIGNVAHDLKTPLAGFLSGMEMIKNISSDIRDSLRHLPPSQLLHSNQNSYKEDNVSEVAHNIRSKISAVDGVLEDIRGVHAFMLMTINRCIDYTKVTNNIKLLPRNETINLYETLLMPFKCMEKMQENVSIVLQPLSRHICSHVITDKQWLQENLLCLLSNAVKYSHNGGTVTIDIALMTRMADDAQSTDLIEMSRNSAPVVVGGGGDIESGGGIDFYHDPSSQHKQQQQQMQYFLRIRVEDTGIGVTEEAAKSLFQPFRQAQRMAGGTGLGLFSLARRLEALQGSYGVHNRTDGRQGSVFWFEIPYRPDVDSSNRFYSTPRHNNINNTTLVSKRLSGASSHNTAVEPAAMTKNNDLTKILANLFRKNGHAVTVAANGAEALNIMSKDLSGKGISGNRAASDNHTGADNSTMRLTDIHSDPTPLYDVVLMDFQMPVMDGLEATRRIREWERNWNGTPFAA